jgi:protein O-GlcNAc transferase
MQLNDKLLTAIHNYQSDNYAEFERISNGILRTDPRNSRALNLLGMSIHERRLSEEGIIFVKKATGVKPDYHAAHNNLGSVYRETKRIELAPPCIDRAIALNPASSDYHLNRAQLLVEIGDYGKSLENFEKTIKQTKART